MQNIYLSFTKNIVKYKLFFSIVMGNSVYLCKDKP